MNLVQMKCLMQVVQSGSVKKAAEALGMKRTTVLMSLNALEAELGQPVLLRKKDGTVLTETGVRIYPTLKKMEETIGQIEALRQKWNTEKQISVFSASTVLLPWLESVHSAYLAEREGEKIKIQMTAADPMDSDFIFALDPSPYAGEEFCRYQILDSPYCACLRAAHPLARENVIDLAAELPYPRFLLADAPLPGYDAQLINSLSSLRRIISTSDCLALIPEVLLKYSASPFETEVVSRKLQNCDLRFTVFLLARRSEQEQGLLSDYARYMSSVLEGQKLC